MADTGLSTETTLFKPLRWSVEEMLLGWKCIKFFSHLRKWAFSKSLLSALSMTSRLLFAGLGRSSVGRVAYHTPGLGLDAQYCIKLGVLVHTSNPST